MDGTDRVVEMLANIQREADAAWLDAGDVHAEQRRDRWWRDAAIGNGAEKVEAAELERQRGADTWIVPGDVAAPLWGCGGCRSRF
jgi:hypothetical protein